MSVLYVATSYHMLFFIVNGWTICYHMRYNVIMKIKFNLDAILKERDISIRKLAAMSGVHYKTALNIFHNHTTGISLETLAGICSALNITPDQLFKTSNK